MELLGARVNLNPRPARHRRAALEVAMLGHAPGRVRVERLRERRDALDEMRRVGFGERVDALGSAAALDHLPVPLHSIAEFDDIFPDARDAATEYASVLAGQRAWLPQAAEDFFANGGETLWVVQVPEAEGQAGFLPAAGTVLHDARTLRGLATVLVIESVGLVALPDLERLQVPANLPDIPRKRLPNPEPRFVPVGTDLSDDHRERRHSDEMVAAPASARTRDLLDQLQRALAVSRPDLQCLYTMPLAYSSELGSPIADPEALADIEHVQFTARGRGLRRIQLLFPYLRGMRYRLVSPAGLVAGLQAGVAKRLGIWRSMAGYPMLTDGKPFPRVDLEEAIRLRRGPGIGVVQYRNGRVSLDDERLAVPALHWADYANTNDPKRYDGFRSAEVSRFLGYLIRELKSLGELLVFNVDFRDPRPRFVLEQFFRGLHDAGALRGRLPEESFHIEETHPQEGAMVYRIEVAPAFPIDRIQLTFTNRSGEWHAEGADV